MEFVAFNNGIDPECNPSTVHIFVNRENLGFEDCDDVDPTQTLDLTADHSMNEQIQLKFVKYQRVKSLTLFIPDNNGGDVTALGGIKIFGFPVETVNMNDFKKQQEM
jgi:PITH domain